MTVKELIYELSLFSPDATVFYYDYGKSEGGRRKINMVQFSNKNRDDNEKEEVFLGYY
jgi:hypothetical protein